MFGLGLSFTIFGSTVYLAAILLPHMPGDPKNVFDQSDRVKDATVGERLGLGLVVLGAALLTVASWGWTSLGG